MFNELRVVGLGATANYQSTLGSLLNPLNILKQIESLRHPALRDILSGFYGVVRPGEMLCGPFFSRLPTLVLLRLIMLMRAIVTQAEVRLCLRRFLYRHH